MSANTRQFILGNAVSLDVITADIQRYLGPDATVQQGFGEGAWSQSYGYWITANRRLTSDMMNELQSYSFQYRYLSLVETQEDDPNRLFSPPVPSGSQILPEFVTSQDLRQYDQTLSLEDPVAMEYHPTLVQQSSYEQGPISPAYSGYWAQRHTDPTSLVIAEPHQEPDPPYGIWEEFYSDPNHIVREINTSRNLEASPAPWSPLQPYRRSLQGLQHSALNPSYSQYQASSSAVNHILMNPMVQSGTTTQLPEILPTVISPRRRGDDEGKGIAGMAPPDADPPEDGEEPQL